MSELKEVVLQAIINNHEELLKKTGNTYIYGLRTDKKEFSVGDELPPSRSWNDWDNDFEEEYLSGTCATGFGCLWFDEDDMESVENALAIQANKGYNGKHQYLIAGSASVPGEDDCEIIIENAFVVAVLK